ncbi:MAG: SCP2 sterol-binding domain-containing protein [Anaerolineales bacterium]
MASFPSAEWMQAIEDKLNTDEKYAQIAHKWEGDVRLIIEPDAKINKTMWLYFDLWHGKCRDAYIEDQTSIKTPAFILKAPYGNFVKVLSGEVSPMQAMMTRMLTVRGSMSVFMRNVPTVLDFVRCCQEVTNTWI